MSACDGGPAFPVPAYTDGLGFVIQPHSGMTLRHHFAGKALVGMLSNPTLGNETGGSAMVLPGDCEKLARLCYAMADAMLAAGEVAP